MLAADVAAHGGVYWIMMKKKKKDGESISSELCAPLGLFL